VVCDAVDFGIAKFYDTALAREIHTNTQSYLGTPGYSAPEQILEKAVDAKAGKRTSWGTQCL